MRGFVPAPRGTFVSAKVPKTMFARARPFGFLRLRPESRWLGNSLRSNNPHRKSIRGSGSAVPEGEGDVTVSNWDGRFRGRELQPITLETAVGSQRSVHALGAPGKIQKCLITIKVTTTFFVSRCTPISYGSFWRPTALSRFNNRREVF